MAMIKVTLCICGLLWWLVCEFVRGRRSTPSGLARLLSVVGLLGAFAFLVIAFLVK